VASPQWDLQDILLPDAFTSLVQTRETLKTTLFAPCPDPEPEPKPEPVPAAPFETRAPELPTPASVPGPAAPVKVRDVSATPARQKRAKKAQKRSCAQD
jgi:hypothetical protein